MAKADRFYFENFTAAAECCNQAAVYLRECLADFHPDNIRLMLEQMHTLEQEDMAQISANIDEVADCIEEVLQRVFVNRV